MGEGIYLVVAQEQQKSMASLVSLSNNLNNCLLKEQVQLSCIRNLDSQIEVHPRSTGISRGF